MPLIRGLYILSKKYFFRQHRSAASSQSQNELIDKTPLSMNEDYYFSVTAD